MHYQKAARATSKFPRRPHRCIRGGRFQTIACSNHLRLHDSADNMRTYVTWHGPHKCQQSTADTSREFLGGSSGHPSILGVLMASAGADSIPVPASSSALLQWCNKDMAP